MYIMRREYFLRTVVVAVAVSIFLSAFGSKVWADELPELSLSAPDTEAHGEYPEDVVMVAYEINGWVCYGDKVGPRRIMKVANSGTVAERAALAQEILKNKNKTDVSFWNETIPASPWRSTGALLVPGSWSVKGCYTPKELEKMKKTAIDWAEDAKKRLMNEGKWGE